MSRLEKLTIVLFVETCFDDEVIVGSQNFELPNQQNAQLTYTVFQKIADVWPNLSASTSLSRNDGSTISVSELSDRLRSNKQWGGPLEFSGVKVHIADLPAMMQIIVTVEEARVGAAGSWEKWVSKFLCDQEFVQAWVADVEYDYWQNAYDPLEYEAAGRGYLNLPMKSNGLPFPLQQDIVDTSQNPARTEIKCGYVEAIGSRIWISQLFWRKSGGSVEYIHDLPNSFTVKKNNCDVSEVRYIGPPFHNDGTDDVQRQLREKLYGIG